MTTKTAVEYQWIGAIPVMLHLHESEITTFPPPAPLHILMPRIGYLPLLVPFIRPLFSDTLPPGEDTPWFEYKGLPLKWYIPTGVLFDMLCAEPESERPWNLTVHFRGYPSNILTPCEGEDAVKWNYMNSLKEAAYIINGNCKNIMNMSQSDQSELWRSVLNVDMESFLKVISKLKLKVLEDKYSEFPSLKPPPAAGNIDNPGAVRTGRIPVRLYLRTFTESFEDLQDAPGLDRWEKLSYINRPVEIDKDEEKCFTLNDALRVLLPEFFEEQHSEKTTGDEVKEEHLEDPTGSEDAEVVAAPATEHAESIQPLEDVEVKLIRIQGIDFNLEIPFSKIPFSWVVNNFMNPDHYLHICVYIIRSHSTL